MDILKTCYLYIRNSWSKLGTVERVLLGLLLLAFLLRISFLIYSPLRGWDESVYLNLGKMLSQHPLIYSFNNAGWTDYIPSTEYLYSWPNIGFRAPLLPYIFSLFYFLKLDYLVNFVVPLFSVGTVFLVYIFGKKLFNKTTGLYAATFLTFLPLHLIFSQKTLTDAFVVFFITLTFYSFWKGYEEDNKKHKVLFGVFLALSLLARYTTLWITPVFLLYFLFRDRSFGFLKDKFLWFAIVAYTAVLTPWFIYGLYYYNNIIGAFIHGFKAAGYYGGIQSNFFFFENWWTYFSVAGIMFVVSLLFIVWKKKYYNKGIILLLLWFIFFIVVVSLMPHKEERFILPIVPVICLLAGYLVDNITKYKKGIVSILVIGMIFTSGVIIKEGYSESQYEPILCYKEANDYIKNELNKENSLIVTNISPMTYYNSQVPNFLLYQEPWNVAEAKKELYREYEANKHVYFLLTNYGMDFSKISMVDWEQNFQKEFSCSKNSGVSYIYKWIK